ncbi:hypothetical protein [Hymenobacter chitinivorans]|uniref:Outer membrane protein with beta-barrel domain n=1 Tax=Hymenobacter chitinivorans DSM 11115 TaxID=1121954 RepID=A0A2M9BMM7_9BACT|nr:hypothetical protein [Hymenobacter chitinivorans]PJJ59186.1 hypothetical protein CLV45_0601 [Hymenobacter chitinivorans DSM 11115]
MHRSILTVAVLLGVSAGAARAQTTTLPTAPVPADAAPKLGLVGPRASYSMSAGFVTAGRFGSASYLTPLASYQLTKRFSVFAGLTYMHIVPGIGATTPEGARTIGLSGLNRYLIQGGGAYALSPRVTLVGSAWKDLTPNTFGNGVNPYAGFSNQGSGVNMRADFKITEHMTISGGVRVSNGVAPGYSPYSLGPFGY